MSTTGDSFRCRICGNPRSSLTPGGLCEFCIKANVTIKREVTKEELLRRVEILEAQILQKTPHVCFTCKFFKAKKPGDNRYCKYEGKIKVEGEVCQCWELEPDPKKRVSSWIG